LKRLAAAAHHGLESPAETRARLLGPSYVRAVGAIRERIPRDGAYALVEAGEPADGGALWLRYELAPRKALDLGPLSQLPPRPEGRAKLPAEVEWVVLSKGRTAPPALLSRSELFRLAGGRERLAP
jgi:hypothetical protein